MHVTRYRPNVRPRPAIIARQRKIRTQKKAIRLEHIKNNLLMIGLVLCIIGAAWVDGGIR